MGEAVSVSAAEYREHAGIAVQMVARDLAAGKEAHQRDVAQGMGDDLHFRIRGTEVRATAACATHVDGTYRGATGVLAGIEFLADFRADAHQILSCGLYVALAEGQLHAGLDQVADGHAVARRVQPDQVPHTGVGTKVLAVAEQVAVGMANCEVRTLFR